MRSPTFASLQGRSPRKRSSLGPGSSLYPTTLCRSLILIPTLTPPSYPTVHTTADR